MVRAYAASAAHRDPERDRLIAEHVDMARRIAGRVARRVPEWIQPDDLVSAALIGLTEAAERFDASQGMPFIAFAERRIRGAVLDELRRGDVMPRRKRQAARKVGATLQKLEQKLGRAPEDNEAAAALGVSVDEYREDLQHLTQVSLVQLDEVVGESRPANENAWPSAELERTQLSKQLKDAIGTLPERDAQLLSLYYVEELSYAEIASVLSISESRVCQLHGRALARLRSQLSEEGSS
jgi:RNA polymerase sigma factor for flagellar operon FliA